jgi:dynein heavy chain, axonemal
VCIQLNLNYFTAGVGGERVRWAELEKFHMGRLATVVGDMLLSVGIIAYLGPFSVDYRKVGY